MEPEFDVARLAEIPDPLDGVDRGRLPAGVTPSTHTPTRAQASALRIGALGAAIGYEAAGLAVLNKRADLYTIDPWTLGIAFAIPASVAVVALIAAAASGPRGMGQRQGRLAALTLAAPMAFILATLALAPRDVDGESFWGHCLRCFLWTAVFTSGPLVAGAWAFRRAFVAAPAWRAAALGVASAAVAAATMSIVCSVGGPAHVLVGHGGMILVAGLGFAWLGPRVLRA